MAQIRSVWDSIPAETQRVFEYIEREIASGRRDPEDVNSLRSTRKIHFARFRRLIGGRFVA